jgi:hypothetical protein
LFAAEADATMPDITSIDRIKRALIDRGVLGFSSGAERAEHTSSSPLYAREGTLDGVQGSQ